MLLGMAPVFLAILLAGCKEEEPLGFASGGLCEELDTPESILQPAGALAYAEWWDCSLPEPEGGDQQFTNHQASSRVFAGSSLTVQLPWDGVDDLDDHLVFVAVEGEDGYFIGEAFSDDQPYTLGLSTQPDAEPGEYTLLLAIDDGTGSGRGPRLGPILEVPIELVAFGQDTDVLVSLAWTDAVDLDLHVIDPTGGEVSWINPKSESGGVLDADGSANCFDDGLRSETIYWPTGTAPSGSYQVAVDYYDDCEMPQASFLVSLLLDNEPAGTWEGTLYPEDVDAPDVVITEFSY